MPDLVSSLQVAASLFRRCRQRGALAVLRGELPEPGAALLARAAQEEGLAWSEVHASTWGLLPEGVVRAALPGTLGPGWPLDDAFCRHAAGGGRGAAMAWQALCERWTGVGDAAEPALPPDDQGFRSRAEVLARVLAAAGEAEPRALLVREAGSIDEGSARAIVALLAGRSAAGWAIVLQAEGKEPWIDALVGLVGRLPDAEPASVDLPATGDEDGPALPRRGSAVELLDMLAASPVPVPVAVLGSRALSEYRGVPPRSCWQDLDGLLEAGRVAVDGPLVRLVHSWAPTAGTGSALSRADCQALRAAVAEVVPATAPLRSWLEAALAAAGGDEDAGSLALAAAGRALALGEAALAIRWLDRASCCGVPAAPLLRARALRLAGDAEGVRRACADGIGRSLPTATEARLQFEAGLAAVELDRPAVAASHLEAAAEAAAGIGDLPLLAATRLVQGRIEEEAGRFGPAARLLGEAAQACERAGAPREAARAFALRALCMGKAGAAERAMKELALARERAADADDPHPAVLDVRILMGVVFRDSGSRESARKALALAAKKAREHADPVREAQGRLVLARVILEAIPASGKERGEALRDGRAAAEEAIVLARGMGRADLEAEGETLLGELSWRAEDWTGAQESLRRQQELWRQAGRAAREVDSAVRRSRLSERQGDSGRAFEAACEALALASRRRLPEQAAQAQLARADALEKLERVDEALAALAEAQRILSGLGEAFAAQATVAEERARRLVARGRER